MFTSVTWQQYTTVILIVLTLYYLAVVILYYKNEILDLIFKKQQNQSQLRSKNAIASRGKNTLSLLETDNTLQQVQELVDRLNETIAETFGKNILKEDLIFSLQTLIKKYSFLKSSPFLASINNLISSEFEKYGYIQLSDDEQVMLWNE